MKTGRVIASAIILLVIATVSGCDGNELDDKMAELKQTIAQHWKYDEDFHKRVDVLMDELGRAQGDSLRGCLEYRLFHEYQYFDTDSARKYASMLMSHEPEVFPNDVLLAWQYSINGETAPFISKFDRIDPTGIPEDLRNDSYNILASSYMLLFPIDERICSFMHKATLDPCLQEDLREWFMGTILRLSDEVNEAREHFQAAYEAADDMHMKAWNAYRVAQTYKESGQNDQYEYWLAQSAIHDFQVPVKAYSALQDLSMAELSKGNFKDASKMVDLFLKDALESKYLARIDSAIKYEQAIISAVSNAEKKNITWLSISAILLLGLSGVLLALQRRNRSLNKALKLSDKEKEEYIHKYMKLSLNYLGSVEKYRHKLRLMLKEEGKDAVVAQLRGPSESEAQYTDFYKEFDETFLKIYPDFVTKVNALLKPEARFPDEHSLNLPLRVLAAIRLGINESKDIATFLNCAPSSVYTYRSKMKANALSEKEKFESDICMIS